MKKLKPIAKKVKKPVILAYLDESLSLQNVIDKAMAAGVTDFKRIRFNHTYAGCICQGDGYCYCDGSYTDERFEIYPES